MGGAQLLKNTLNLLVIAEVFSFFRGVLSKSTMETEICQEIDFSDFESAVRFCIEYATKDEFENKRKFKEKLEQIPDNDLSFKLNKENDVHVKKIFKETTEKNI